MFDVVVNMRTRAFDDGLAESNISAFVRERGRSSDSIEISPESFERQLRLHGPFVYIESIQQNRLPIELFLKTLRGGGHYSHVVVITGITTQRGFVSISFNDPGTGQSSSMNFFDFVTTYHKPLRGLDRSLVIYFDH